MREIWDRQGQDGKPGVTGNSKAKSGSKVTDAIRALALTLVFLATVLTFPTACSKSKKQDEDVITIPLGSDATEKEGSRQPSQARPERVDDPALDVTIEKIKDRKKESNSKSNAAAKGSAEGGSKKVQASKKQSQTI